MKNELILLKYKGKDRFYAKKDLCERFMYEEGLFKNLLNVYPIEIIPLKNLFLVDEWIISKYNTAKIKVFFCKAVSNKSYSAIVKKQGALECVAQHWENFKT